ncbi:MFS transporter [Streptomyces sp. DG2A-72]|uniref:MFS transporter n=1 Tax=Streptomyces sp. DG2A-72 TaxID=3051386 RepID=UPI00265BBEF2|nr:MFS transporter [Streptomyces sp. DG2A-72]MDO0939248.1 MFS transporter [Streptomyces sp. DG2A-72]
MRKARLLNWTAGPGPRIGWAARVREAGAPLAVRPYRLHFTARVLSWTGSAVSPIALAFAVLHIGGGAGALGLVLAASVAPQILLLLVGGVVADRLPRHRVMVWSNIVCALAEALAAALLWSGTARVWHLVLMSGICGAASAFFTPAAGGIVKEVVPAEARHAANALLKIAQNLVKVSGPAIGGLLVAVFGSAWAIGWDALTFAASAVLFARIDLKPGAVKVKAGFLADLRDGWTDFRSRRWLWVMVVQGALVVPVWLVGYQLLGPVYGARFLGGAGLWGLVVSGFTAGLVAGAAVALMWRPRLVGRVVCAGTGSLALPLAAMAAAAPLPVLVAATAAAGTGLAVSMTVWSGLVQERIPADRLSRALSYSTLGQLVPVPFGYLLAGPVSRAVGVRATLAGGALVIVLAAVVPLLIRQVRALALAGQSAHEPVPTETAGVSARAPR